MNNVSAKAIGWVWVITSIMLTFKGVNDFAVATFVVGQAWLIASSFIKE